MLRAPFSTDPPTHTSPTPHAYPRTPRPTIPQQRLPTLSRKIYYVPSKTPKRPLR